MFTEPQNSFYDSHDVYAQPRRAEKPKAAVIQAVKHQMPANKIAGAIRRLALLELGQLAEGRVVLPFSVVPEIVRKSHGANWRLIIAPSATGPALRALRAAEAVLQSRWDMVDMFADSRALIV